MRLPKRGFNNPFQKKIQSINFHHIDLILNKYKIKPDEIKESVLFEKKIFNRSKGLLKLLDVGELKSSINKFKEINFFHVPREKNKRADELANKGIDNTKGSE